MKNFYRHLHPLSKIGVIALVATISLLVFWLLSFVLVIPIFGKDVFSDLIAGKITFDETNIGLLKFLQLAQSIGLFVVPSIILAYLFGGEIDTYLHLDRKPWATSVLLSVLVIFAASPLINQLGIWNSEMSLPHWLSSIEKWMRESEDAAEKLTTLFVQANSIKALLFNVLLIGIIPAIGEELLFRGIIQRVFTEWTGNKHLGIWITAILFSGLHFQFYGFIPRAILGAMFGYLLIYSGNLWLPVIAHFVNNTAAVLAYYFYNKGVIQFDPDTIGTNAGNGIAAIISVFVVLLLLFYYYKFENRKRLEI
ncbi:MAG: lysostaphin resistance A-like protein [Prolixibacteraceae bacterium]